MGCNLGEKVLQICFTSPSFDLKEKSKCKDHIGKSKIKSKARLPPDFSLSESSRLSLEQVEQTAMFSHVNKKSS